MRRSRFASNDRIGKQLADAGINEAALRSHLSALGTRIQDIVDRTARQVKELRQSIERFAEQLNRQSEAIRASNLIKRLLGIRDEQQASKRDADDRSAGYPLRRFAEFGVLPGYEFPTEPAALRLLSDEYEDDPVTTDRRFGIGQFQPLAPVFARTKRWRVTGIDTSSPWNPHIEGPSWQYRVCRGCGLRHRSDKPRCPRCLDDQPAPDLPAVEYGGFVATRNEAPVMSEEDRFAARNLVRVYPQWDGTLVKCWTVGDGWQLQLRRGETVDWLNEGPPPSTEESGKGLCLHDEGLGYTPCGVCGRLLSSLPMPGAKGKTDPFGHAKSCQRSGQPPRRVAIATERSVETLRLVIPVPRLDENDMDAIDATRAWGHTLGEALLAGIRHAYMVDENELVFDLEGPWTRSSNGLVATYVSITVTDPTVGGSGYLERVAAELNIVAEHALQHLVHPECETACYRCLIQMESRRPTHPPTLAPLFRAVLAGHDRDLLMRG